VSIGTQVLFQQPGFLDLKALESADVIHSRHPTEVLCMIWHFHSSADEGFQSSGI